MLAQAESAMNAFSAPYAQPLVGRMPAIEAPRRDIVGVQVAALTRDQALALIARAFDRKRHLRLAYCNAHLANFAANDAALRAALSGFLILPDGIGVDVASQLLHGTHFPANLNGTDFTPALLAAQREPLRVMLLGGKPGIAERAAARLQDEHPQHDFAVLSHGYFSAEEEAALLARLEYERPDLLLVAFGNPRQEKWIAEKLGPRHCSVAAGIGAFFDFLAGEVTRAPLWIRRLRMEWLYRLWLEPGRLWRRYVVGNPIFLLRVLRQRLTGRKVA